MATVQTSTSSDLRAPVAPPQRIPLSEPWLAGNEWVYVKECVESGWISSVGPFVARFERKFIDDYVGGAAYAVAVMNGTAGLHLALRAILVEPEDEVLVPSLTFIAPVNAIRYCGAHPVFVDVDRATWQMDVKQVEAFLQRECEVKPDGPGPGVSTKTCWRKGRRVRAILPVHLLGLACDMERIKALAEQFHLKIIEDAAEAIGVRFYDQPVGTWGDIGVFSFNGNKTVTCGGGGMLVTRNPLWANRIRYLSTQARDDVREYYHKEIGYNYRLTNVHAAIGLAQLERVDQLLQRKREIAAAYQHALRDIEGITLMPTPTHTEPGYWLYTILLQEGTTVAQRNEVIEQLAADGLEARPLWQPIHTLPPYQHCDKAGSIEVAPDLYARAMSLPSSARMTDAECERCVAIVRRVLAAS